MGLGDDLVDDSPIHGCNVRDTMEDSMTSHKATQDAYERAESHVRRLYATSNLKDLALDKIHREAGALALALSSKVEAGELSGLTREEFRALLELRDVAIWGLAPTGREMPRDGERDGEGGE